MSEKSVLTINRFLVFPRGNDFCTLDSSKEGPTDPLVSRDDTPDNEK